MMTLKRRHFLVSSTSALLPAAATRARAQPTAGRIPIKFTLDFRITGQTSPFFLALRENYYRDAGLDVSIDVGVGSAASVTRVASGAYQMGLGDVSSLLEFNARESGPGRVQAVYQYYNRAPFVIIGRKASGVTNDFQSLGGKRVAASATESVRRVWPLVARRLQVDPAFFEWITTDFSARDNVMVRGDVDAATYFHDSSLSLFARLKPEELSVLKFSDAGLDLYGNAILASGDLIRNHPGAVAAFLAATNRAIRETFADPARAIAATRQREPILDAGLESARWGIAAQYVGAPEARLQGLGDVRDDVLSRQVRDISEVFGLKAVPSPDALFTRAFLPPKAERMLDS